MRHASAGEHAPIGFINRTLIADDQRANITFDAESWADIGPGDGTLERFDTPKSLSGKAATD